MLVRVEGELISVKLTGKGSERRVRTQFGDDDKRCDLMRRQKRFSSLSSSSMPDLQNEPPSKELF